MEEPMIMHRVEGAYIDAPRSRGGRRRGAVGGADA